MCIQWNFKIISLFQNKTLPYVSPPHFAFLDACRPHFYCENIQAALQGVSQSNAECWILSFGIRQGERSLYTSISPFWVCQNNQNPRKQATCNNMFVYAEIAGGIFYTNLLATLFSMKHLLSRHTQSFDGKETQLLCQFVRDWPLSSGLGRPYFTKIPRCLWQIWKVQKSTVKVIA